MAKKKTYSVMISWENYGTIEVKATSSEKAQEIVEKDIGGFIGIIEASGDFNFVSDSGQIIEVEG